MDFQLIYLSVCAGRTYILTIYTFYLQVKYWLPDEDEDGQEESYELTLEELENRFCGQLIERELLATVSYGGCSCCSV